MTNFRTKTDTAGNVKKYILDKCEPLSYEEEAVATNDELVTHNIRFMISIFRNYLKIMPFSEYVSEIVAALYNAAERFDRKSGHKFNTYARPWVSLYLWEYKYKMRSVVSMNSMAWKRIINIRKFKAEFSLKYGREPNEDDYMEHFKWGEVAFRRQMFYERNLGEKSIHDSLMNSKNDVCAEKQEYGDLISEFDVVDGSVNNVQEDVETSDLLEKIYNNFSCLNDLERSVMEGLYVDGLKDREVAKKNSIKITTMYSVRDDALKKLREFI